MTDPVFAVDGVIRRYDWGSRTAIQTMLEVDTDGRPAAELWFGAHHGDPSPALGTTLAELIAADPVDLLGSRVVEQFGPRLPFLLKVLAAEQALSIQVHPTRAQATAGFAAEAAGGGGGDATYVDDNHKPELLCALTPFEALCGFRRVTETLALLDDIAVPELDFVAELLRGPDPLRAAFTALLTLDDPGPVVAAVVRRAGPDGPLRAAWLAAQHFSDDIGVVLTVLLNHVRLEPGQAIYLAAGNVHAYLRGTGVEIMANSDNVLRCGLTSKHVDVPELLRITDFSELAEPRWPLAGTTFEVPVPDFRLQVVTPDAAVTPDARPSIVLCVAGLVTVGGVELRPGHAAFVRADAQPLSIDGTGQAFIATTG